MMMIDILNKILLFLFILSILNIVRNGFFLIKSFTDKERFVLKRSSLFILGLSVAYVFLMLIDGIKI